MNKVKGFLIIICALFLASCQVKEKVAGGGLISGHAPSSNSFSIQTPASHVYVTAETFSVTVTFPFEVTVTGSPRLLLTVGATPRYATYASGSDTKTLTFQYTIVAADNDTDGITINSLELNGGTLQFDNHGTATDCEVSTVSTTTLTGSTVDNTAPSVTAFAMTSLPKFYNVGATLSFSITYSEAVVVTGSPYFSVTFAVGPAKHFTYVSGSGTTTLNFSYVIENDVADTNAYDTITALIVLNGGTIKDAGANNASLDFSAYSAAVRTGQTLTRPLDGRVPYIVSVTPPTNGSYASAQSLDFVANFNENVNVSGSHYLSVGIGSNVRQATYVSRTSNRVLFRYTTVPGDVDTDGITLPTIAPALTPVVVMSSGDITSATTARSFYSPVTNNTFTAPTMTGVLVSSIQPQPQSVSRNTDITPTYGVGTTMDNVWNIGQELLITVTFNTAMYVDQTNGTPTLEMTFNGVAKEATYLSGGNGQTSLVFRYVVLSGDSNPATSVTIGNLKLNGGVITDVAATNTLLTFPTAQTLASTSIDGVRPTISSVTAPANGSYSTVTAVNNTQMRFRMIWSEIVQYGSLAADMAYMNMNVGGTVLKLNVEGTSTNPATTFYSIPPSLATYNDTNGVAVSSPLVTGTTIRDSAGNDASVLTFTPPVTTSVLVDTTAPTVLSVTPPANRTYLLGETITFSVLFSETVSTNQTATHPRIVLNLNTGNVNLRPATAGLSTTHSFSYTVATSDLDADGVAIIANSVVSNSTTSGYVRDAGHNLVTGTFTAPVTTSIFVDAVVPGTPSAVATTSGSYDSGDNLEITLTYNDNINIVGTPRIEVFADSDAVTPMYFNYFSGSGTPTIVYRKTLGATDIDFTGLTSSVSAVSLNSGTIKDVSGNTVTSNFTAVNLSSHYLVYPNTTLWTKSDFVSRALAGGPVISNPAAADVSACAGGLNVCQNFDGDDALHIATTISNAETVYLVLTTPLVVADYNNFLGSDLSLKDDGGVAFDLTSTDAAITVSAYSGTGTIHDTNLAPNTTYVFEIVFTAPLSFAGPANLISPLFLGQFGEAMIINGSTTAPERAVIKAYLDSIY